MQGPLDGKQAKLHKLYETSMNILSRGNIQDLTPAKLARGAKISRAWIYKYFGKNRDDLLKAAIQYFGRAFADLDSRTSRSGVEDQIEGFLEGSQKLLDFTKKYPWALPIYFRYRGTQNPIGNQIGEIEDIYLKTLSSEAQKNFSLSIQDAQVFADYYLSLRMGLAFRWQNTDLPRRVEFERLQEIQRHWLISIAKKK